MSSSAGRRLPGSVLALALVLLAFAAHALIVAAPGFYANDEWQKFDHVRLHGFADFARAYGVPRPGPEFGYPVRPLGFLVQGAASLGMQSAPWAAHAVGVALHALVALVFVAVLRRAGVNEATRWLAGALFVLSPLATMAAGWLAASFDLLYVLFLLLAAAAVVDLPGGRLTPLRAAWLLLATAAALLSKETAVVAPAVVLLVALALRTARPDQFSWRPFVAAIAVALVPVVAYLAFRAPAIAASLAGHADPAYTPGARHVVPNAWRFFAFPFRLKLVEMSAAVFRSPWQPLLAAGAHLALVAAVARLYGARWAALYVAGYFVFLLPVLALPNPGIHCLYGSALAMALALGAVLSRAWATRRAGLAVLAGIAVAALAAHGLVIQRHLYDSGGCQTRFLASAGTLLATSPAGLLVVPDPDAAPMTRIAIRTVSAREAFTIDDRPAIAFAEGAAATSVAPEAGRQRVRLTAACTLRPDPAPAP